MKYLLGTNAVIALVNRRSARLRERIREQQPADVGLSVIVLHELYYRAYKSQRPTANLGVVDGLAFEAVDFTKEDACEAGELRAAQAKLRGLVLITANTTGFARIADLQIENWLDD